MKCGKKGCPGKAKCKKCKPVKATVKGKKIPTPKAKGQRGAVKSPTKAKSAYGKRRGY